MHVPISIKMYFNRNSFCHLSVSGKGILSGHADGTVVRYFFDDDGSGESQVQYTPVCILISTKMFYK